VNTIPYRLFDLLAHSLAKKLWFDDFG